MSCRRNRERIAEICIELMKMVDESRTSCDRDECELINCVVHDCVYQMLRALQQSSSGTGDKAAFHTTKRSGEVERPVN